MKKHIWTLALLIILTGYAGSPVLGQTRTINVDPIADDNPAGGCTLREAIDLANAEAVAGMAANGCMVVETAGGFEYVINLPAYTYTLTRASSDTPFGNVSGDLDIVNFFPNPPSVTINGIDATKTIIDGGAIDRIIDIAFSFGGSAVTINGVTITNGSVPNYGDGGGIYMRGGTMILNNSTVSGNAASRGGGIYNHAGNVVVLNNSTVSGNLALSFGGGFQNYGTLVVNNSTVSGNIANSNTGGISNVGGTVRLTHSVP